MRIRGLRRVQRIVRRFMNRNAPRALILLYHRVAEVGSDPWSLCVTPQHFAEHLEVLREHSCPLRLQRLTQALQDRKRSHRSVVITFDDGYADNLYNAKPLLERYDIPATVFVTTGGIEHEREFWWDEMERLLLQPGTLPAALRLRVNGSTYRWDLGEAAHYSEAGYQPHRGWSASGEDNPSPRHYLYRSLYQLLRPLLAGERRKVIDELVVWAGAEPVSRSTHRSLSLEEVSDLGQGELIEIGAHTVTHPFLSTLPTALQQDEIQRSKTCLEEIVGHPVISFAYPHGDYTARTIAVVREAGFACACSTVADSVWQSTDRFQLPRVEVQDWDGEEFTRKLSRWFYG